MNTTEKTDLIIPALEKAQQNIGAAGKNVENTFYDTKYADLGSVIGAVKKPLLEQGLFIIQTIEGEPDKPFVLTRLQHNSGQFIETVTPVIMLLPKGYMSRDGKEIVSDHTQAFGKAITLTRRYALQTLLSIPSVDDERTWAEAVLDHKPNVKKTDADIIQEMIKDHEERANDPDTFPAERERLFKVVEQLKENLRLELEKNGHEETVERPPQRTGSRTRASNTPSSTRTAPNTQKAQNRLPSELEEMKGWRGYRLVGYTNPVYKDKKLGELNKEHIKMLWTQKGEKNQNATDSHLAEESAWIREAAVDIGIISE